MRAAPFRLHLVPALVVLALLAGCGSTEMEITERTEDEPFDDRSNVLSQGLVSCSQRTATGYVNGVAKAITVVDADARPAGPAVQKPSSAVSGD
ncbi:MAG: hypothetical protein ACYC8T_19805 [Myxococcaceae bacterium]